MSGYSAEPNLEAMNGTSPVQARASGSGRVVLFTDNPVFRGHWLGSSKLLANAIFFASLVTAASGDSDGTEEEADEDM